jgi:hypothetical protein
MNVLDWTNPAEQLDTNKRYERYANKYIFIDKEDNLEQELFNNIIFCILNKNTYKGKKYNKNHKYLRYTILLLFISIY